MCRFMWEERHTELCCDWRLSENGNLLSITDCFQSDIVVVFVGETDLRLWQCHTQRPLKPLRNNSNGDTLHPHNFSRGPESSSYRLKVQQRVHCLWLGVVVLSVHVSPVLGPPFCDDDGESCGGQIYRLHGLSHTMLMSIAEKEWCNIIMPFPKGKYYFLSKSGGIRQIYVHGVGLGVPFCVSKMLKYAFSFPISTVVF